MTGIVERLIEIRFRSDRDDVQVIDTAAAEITRLRAEAEALRKALIFVKFDAKSLESAQAIALRAFEAIEANEATKGAT